MVGVIVYTFDLFGKDSKVKERPSIWSDVYNSFCSLVGILIITWLMIDIQKYLSWLRKFYEDREEEGSNSRLKFIQTIDVEQVNEYEELRKAGLYGFAEAYLISCKIKAKSDDEIDVEVYTKLVELDSKLGTTASKQLDRCLFYTNRSDIIQVLIFAQNLCFKIILDYRL